MTTMKDRPSIIALIPARSGSKRIPDKNIRHLGDHPLLAYTIAAARTSKIFDRIVVSTDSPRYAEIAVHYGAEAPFLRSTRYAAEYSPDIEWVRDTLDHLEDAGEAFDAFSILRPTSPFRQPDTIRRAWEAFISETGVDSLRAVEPCRQHPGKMWIIRGRRMLPLLPHGPSNDPWHSRQYPSLPEVYVQNASLEIAWIRVVGDTNTIAGSVVVPFMTRGLEGFDLNTPEDWKLARSHINDDPSLLPEVDRPPTKGGVEQP